MDDRTVDQFDVEGGAEVGRSTGAVYTQPWVVELMLDLVGYRPECDLALLVAVEPAAGEGAFLREMARRLAVSLKHHRRAPEEAASALQAWELDPAAAEVAVDGVTAELVAEGLEPSEARLLAEGWMTVGDYLLDRAEASSPVDLVLGNPPYIRYDDLPVDRYAEYQSRHPTMAGRCDIYVGFIEAGVRQLAPDGVLAFICADRWMQAAYGSKLRDLVSRCCSVDAVIEMHDAPAFVQPVAAYPAVVVLRKREQGSVVVAKAGRRAGRIALDGSSQADALLELAAGNGESVPGFEATTVQTWFAGRRPWPWLSPSRLELLRSIEGRLARLGDPGTSTRVGIGVATGADAIFVVGPESSHGIEEERLLPLAVAADTGTGSVMWSGHYLVNPWETDGSLVDWSCYPGLAAYLHSHEAALRRRHVARRDPVHWYRTIDRVKEKLLETPKLYFPDMRMRSDPALDRGETYPHHGLYYVSSDSWDLEVLGGILMSEVAQLFIEAYSVRMRGGTLRFQAQNLRQICVPRPENVPIAVQDALRRAFSARDHHAATLAALMAYDLPKGSLA